MSQNPERTKIYRDSNILAFWVTALADPSRKFPRRVEDARRFLLAFQDGKLDLALVVSEWCLEELIQSYIDKALWAKFPFEAPEFRELRAMRDLGLTQKEIQDITAGVQRFEKLLEDLKVQFVPNVHDHKRLHELVSKHMLQSPDALHVLTARMAVSSTSLHLILNSSRPR